MQTQSSLRIAFISTLSTPFILDDLNSLKKHFNVKVGIGSGFSHILKIIILCFNSDIAFCWFASTYTSVVVAVMRILRRRTIIVIGGVDVARDEKLNYGIWLVPWKAVLVKFAIKHADKILAVDKSLAEKACLNAAYDGKNIEVLPTGYDTGFWKMSGEKKSQRVLTVAYVDDMKRFHVKGIDLLFEAARLLPQVSFMLIGLTEKIVKSCNPPSNIELIPPMDRSLLLPYYQSAMVYCQPSRQEGMPNVICEAMLCGCIPVATDVGAAKSIVGEVGICIPPESGALARALIKSLKFRESYFLAARERIASMFDRQTREKKLNQIIDLLSE